MKVKNMKINGKYNFKNQQTKLIYLGLHWDESGCWHQFSTIENPYTVWSELAESDLWMIEETK